MAGYLYILAIEGLLLRHALSAQQTANNNGKITLLTSQGYHAHIKNGYADDLSIFFHMQPNTDKNQA